MNVAFKRAIIRRVGIPSCLFSLKDKMPKIFLGIVILFSAQNIASAEEQNRAAKPLFKGAELYSWKLPSSNTWRFSLCVGTNRNKTLAEIQHKCHVMNNLRSLKKRLSILAVGEYVTWSSPYPQLSIPPETVLQEIRGHAISRQINLTIAK